MEMKENGQKKMLLSVLGVAILVVAVIGISFAAYSNSFDSDENTVSTGTIMVSYTEPTSAIYIDDALPISDTVGIGLSGDGKSFDFTVSTQATEALTIPYEISLTKVDTSTLTDSQVKVYLTKNGTAVLNPTLVNDLTASNVRVGSKVLYTTKDEFTATGQPAITTSYVLKMWIDERVDLADIADTTYVAKVNVDSAVAPIK